MNKTKSGTYKRANTRIREVPYGTKNIIGNTYELAKYKIYVRQAILSFSLYTNKMTSKVLK